MKKLTNKKGFTLVELLVVVAIIAILMLIALPRMLDSTKGAKIRTFESNARTLISAANISYANNNSDVTKVSGDLQSQIDEIYDGSDVKNSKPVGASYSVDSATGKLTCTLVKDHYDKNNTTGDDYVIEYDPSTGKVKQKVGSTEGIPSGGTKLTSAK